MTLAAMDPALRLRNSAETLLELAGAECSGRSTGSHAEMAKIAQALAEANRAFADLLAKRAN